MMKMRKLIPLLSLSALLSLPLIARGLVFSNTAPGVLSLRGGHFANTSPGTIPQPVLNPTPIGHGGNPLVNPTFIYSIGLTNWIDSTGEHYRYASGLSVDIGLDGSSAVTNANGTMHAWDANGNLTLSGTITFITNSGAAPNITSFVSGDTVTAPAPAQFTVTASGTAPLSYQWRVNKGGGTTNVSGTEYSGATAGTITINPTAGGDAGTYYCTVSNSYGAVTSGGYVLTVNTTSSTNSGDGSAPSISVQPQSLAVGVGSNATFAVSAGGTAPLAYQWKLNGSSLAGASASTYTTNNVPLEANGSSYIAVVTNASGSVTSTAATLTVTNGTSGGSGAAPAFVQSGATSGDATQIISITGVLTNPVTAGNIVVASCFIYGVGETNHLTDTLGCNWTLATNITYSSGNFVEAVYYSTNVPGGTLRVTNTFNSIHAYCGIALGEYSGVAKYAPLDTCIASSGGLVSSGTSIPFGPMTTMQGNDLAFLWFGLENATPVIGSPFTSRSAGSATATWDVVATNAGPISVSVSHIAAANSWAGIMLGLKHQ